MTFSVPSRIDPDPNFSEETPPVEVLDPDAACPTLIVCDHASNQVPPRLAGLGLTAAALDRHIAWDIGAAVVARRLAKRLGASAVLSCVSRLVIDCNRPLGHDTSICEESDGTGVPGNRRLEDGQVRQRATDYFYPYHGAISTHLGRIEASGNDAAAVIAVHSFTPEMNGQARPWHVGILWNRDPRLAVPLIEALRADGGLEVGDNQPYSGRTSNYTVDLHGGSCGRPHVSIEIRQDLLISDPMAEGWGDRLADLLAPLLARPENRLRRMF
ncbi:N-formylglutamate amidohydrolase [Telmatospirillum siberiense]|uniref:N-formylglutamate amidohydrolase n=1 Tax=Telmatospirillum siberiense TaxID=382514 RepID=A0A2N3PP35_9PROT|nr:N-formylglutamate amidohydrolase [Telmatospirillum siberiense]PKU22179.1 N-formylglutamate amidohydrolase [Telmatospirillum siberiense]